MTSQYPALMRIRSDVRIFSHSYMSVHHVAAGNEEIFKCYTAVGLVDNF